MEDIMESQANTVEITYNNKSIMVVMRSACKKIAPLWSLENFVAVNPYLGLIDKKFNQVALDLDLVAGIQTTLPLQFYLEKIEKGEIPKEILSQVLSENKYGPYDSFIQKIKSLKEDVAQKEHIPTIAGIVSKLTEQDWKRFSTSRISFWAAGYFDEGQAVWKSKNKSKGLFLSWKSEALIDRTPDLSGLIGFRDHLKKFSDNASDAAHQALKQLNIPDEMLPYYLHALLLQIGGWAAFAARVDWDKELYGGEDGELIEFLSVLLCWEACLLKSIHHDLLEQTWQKQRMDFVIYDIDGYKNEVLAHKLLLQESFDLANQQKIIQSFGKGNQIQTLSKKRPSAQAVFCIDVRSEVFRRNLETANHTIETYGFAGFFAFPIKYTPIGHQHGIAQCPVLLKTGPTILEEMTSEDETQEATSNRLLNQHARQLLKSVKHGAITCFSYVSPLGLSFLPKLFTDSFGLTRPVPNPDNVGFDDFMVKNKRIRLDVDTYTNSGIALEQQISMAKNALTAMSLTENFAKFVLITGHGASTVNNPHATGLDCGACGGHTGEANARVAAAIFNNKSVQEGLKQHGIHIPSDTIFLACLHDTTTDEINIYNEYDIHPNQQIEFDELKESLEEAGKISRMERALRMSSINKSNIDDSVIGRSKDWSQVRPEWGLAGCYGFVVAPRERTKGINFGGKSFLHSYNWRKDTDFSILELIMTAPMIVTSWINLQYYASTVDNKKFGSGNKTLHNITSGIGVLEGYSGDLRVGLPIQSVFDGEKYQHEPVKLNVIIEAPIEAMNRIIEKHSMVRNLLDHNWIHLLAMNADGVVCHRYDKNLNWVELN